MTRERRALDAAAATWHQQQQQEAQAIGLHRMDTTASTRPCGACGVKAFNISVGETRTAEATGTPLPTRCRHCRPTRRAALALGLAR